MRVLRAILIATLVLAAAGCGGEDLGVGGGSGAELLKPGAVVYWEIESDPESDQWQQVEELLKRFPDGDRWIAELERSFESDSEVTWEETKAALGNQLAIAVYAQSLANVAVVGLTNPDDPDKTLDFIRKANAEEDDPADRLLAREVDGWVVVSDKDASIDAALKGDGQALSDADGFTSAMDELPDDALSRAYFDPAAAVDAFGSADPEATKMLQTLGLGKLDFAGAWAKAKDNGGEVAAVVSGEGAERLLGTGETYVSKLLDRVPDDAFAFYSFQGEAAAEQFDSLRDNPLYAMAIQEFERQAGVRVEDLVSLFRGEVAFYAAPGAPIPELTLLLEAANAAEARQSAANLLRTLARLVGGQVTEAGGVTTANFQGFTVNVGSIEGAVVITTAKAAFEELAATGDKLADSEPYKQALDAAGVPDEYTGLLYTDLNEAVNLFLGFAGAAEEDVPPEVSRNLEPLRSFVVYGKRDGNLSTSLAFLEIGE